MTNWSWIIITKLLVKISYMKLDNYYCFEYSDYWLHFSTFQPIFSSAFYKWFMMNSGFRKESRTESFIWTTVLWFKERVQFVILCGLPRSTWKTWRKPKDESAVVIIEGSFLSSNRNSPKSERIENAPLAFLISTEQFQLHACFGVIRRGRAPFRGLPLDGFICTSAPLTDMRPH